MTVHMPLGKDDNGVVQWHKRVVTEIGSFEAYPMRTTVQRQDEKGRTIEEQVFKKGPDGKVMYTMNTADRVASSVSRGLVKCLARAFNIGLELSEKETVMDDKIAWNVLLRFGLNQGLTRDEIIEIVKSAGLTRETMVDKFQVGYAAVYNASRKQVEEEVPFD